MRVRWLGVVSMCVLGLAACSGTGSGLTHNFTTARDRWESKAPSAYAFTLHWDSAWIPPQQMRVTVEDGRVTSPSPGPSPGRLGGDGGTIDQMPLYDAHRRPPVLAVRPRWGCPHPLPKL